MSSDAVDISTTGDRMTFLQFRKSADCPRAPVCLNHLVGDQ